MNRKPTLYEYFTKATTDIYPVISNETNTEWIKGTPDYILSHLLDTYQGVCVQDIQDTDDAIIVYVR